MSIVPYHAWLVPISDAWHVHMFVAKLKSCKSCCFYPLYMRHQASSFAVAVTPQKYHLSVLLARSFTLRLQQTTQLSSSLPKGWHPQSELPFFHALASSLQMPQSLHRFRFICLRGDLNAARDLSLARILSLILASAATPFLYQPLSLELDSS